MRRTLVAGNWKMHGSLAENQTRLNALANADLVSEKVQVAVFPTFPYIGQCRSVLGESGIQYGAQNVSEYAGGAYTGEVSGEMLVDFGCDMAIIGHSERRAIFGETSEQVADKFVAAQAAGVIPVLCVGETLEERESGSTEAVVAEQIQAVLEKAGIEAFAQAVIAYEPVWAIGTGKTATPDQAQQVHSAIRAQLASADSAVAQSVQILYGGSVKPNNAAEIFAQPDVDGALVGGASLAAEDFIQICQAAA